MPEALGGWTVTTTRPPAKEAVMPADTRPTRDPQLTDHIEDAAFLGMLFSGAAIVVTIVLLLVLF
jgi:hypothetical protein